MINVYSQRGAGPGSNTKEISDKLGDLRKELEGLDDIERRLDEQRMWIQQSLKNIAEDPENGLHAYVTHEDICKCFHGETLLAVQAPSGTQLEVPVPENVSINTYVIKIKAINYAILKMSLFSMRFALYSLLHGFRYFYLSAYVSREPIILLFILLCVGSNSLCYVFIALHRSNLILIWLSSCCNVCIHIVSGLPFSLLTLLSCSSKAILAVLLVFLGVVSSYILSMLTI